MSGYSQNYYGAGEDPYSAISGSYGWDDYSPSSHGSAWPSTSSSSRLDPRSPVSPYLSAPSPNTSYALSDAGTSDPDMLLADSSPYKYAQTQYPTDDQYYSPGASPKNDYPSSSKQGEGEGHFCLAPKCTSKPFKRNADLDRHYKQRHFPDEDTYHCDYPKCPRKDGQPFHRKAHFRDHLRDYHAEDLGKRGKQLEKGMEKKHVRKDWWRCTRCLKRVIISKHQFECPDCKQNCDTSRANMRRSL